MCTHILVCSVLPVIILVLPRVYTSGHIYIYTCIHIHTRVCIYTWVLCCAEPLSYCPVQPWQHCVFISKYAQL